METGWQRFLCALQKYHIHQAIVRQCKLFCFDVVFHLGPAMPSLSTEVVGEIAGAASVVQFLGVVKFCKIVQFSVPFFITIHC